MRNNSQNVSNCIKKRKHDLKSIFHNRCCICGFNAFDEALDFHHVDPTQKSFGLSAANSTTKSLEKQIEEVEKCILVCANCHRGIHAGYLNIPEDWQTYFSKERAQELLDDKEYKTTHQDNYCQRCGKKIDSSSTFCVDCWNIQQRVVERPSREELKTLIRTTPFTMLARRYNVSDNAIRKWCDGYKLPRKKSEIKAISDEDWAEL